MKISKLKVEEIQNTMAYVIENDTFNLRHKDCGKVVLINTNGKSKYQCMHCDLDVGKNDIFLGGHHTDAEFEELCINTRDLLLLDESEGD
mgnify:CR=1 FL=1